MWRARRQRGGVGSGREVELEIITARKGTQVGKNCHMFINQIKSLFRLARGPISIILGLQGHKKTKIVPKNGNEAYSCY